VTASPATRLAPVARYLLLGATVFLALGGLLMIFSASAVTGIKEHSDTMYFVKRQAIFLVLGFGALLVASRLSVPVIKRVGVAVLAAGDLMLALVLVMGRGNMGSVRALSIGVTTIQPAEIARLGCVLVMASLFADRIRRPRPIKEDIFSIVLIAGIPFGLVMLQPDMGAAMSILIAVFFVMVLGGLPWKWVGATVGGIAAGVAAVLPIAAYRSARIAAWLDPSKDPLGNAYQVLQARLAFGSGGVLGLGLGMSRQKFFYLPAAHTDFIFAIIGEELGLLGTLAVVVAFGVFCYAGVRIALAVKDPYSRIVAGGLTITIVTQALINMASVTGLIPVAGEPLPMLSYGGSSLLFTMGCIGLILAMTRGSARASFRLRPHAIEEEGSARARSGERRGNGRPRLSGIDGGRARVSRRS
jgi:cell division protein FtsW